MFSGLTSLVFFTAILSAPTSQPAKGGNNSAQGTQVEVEVVELRGTRTSHFGFVVAVHGEVEAWISNEKDARFCKLKSEPQRSRIHLDLHCDGDRTNKYKLHVVATRGLKLQERTMLAEIQQPGGAKSQVFVTLR